MRYNFRIIAIAALFVGLTSCESVVDGLNQDPNNFTDISLALVTNHAVLNMVTIAEAEPARITGMWTDQFDGSDRQYITQDNYGVADADFDPIWADIYRNGIAQTDIGIAKAQEDGQDGLLGVNQILKGYYAAEAALLFGDVPFSQANQADKFQDPVYDAQQSVLDAAVGLLDDGAANAGSLSVTAGNSVLSSSSTWAQFANALKARYLLAQRDYDGALAAAQDAGFDAASNSVDVVHSTTNFAENLFFQFEGEQRADYLTFDGCHLIQMLSDTTDVSRADAKTNDSSRRAFFMAPSASGFDGLNLTGYFSPSQDFPIIGYPEVQLIIAECAVRTDDNETAVAALNNARNYWDGLMGTDDYQDYVEADFADDDALLMAILQEKFASVFGTPTFYDVIRTDNMIGTDLDGRDTPVQRFLYPASEGASNANFPGLKSLSDPTPINM
jgi:hypothetical protein